MQLLYETEQVNKYRQLWKEKKMKTILLSAIKEQPHVVIAEVHSSFYTSVISMESLSLRGMVREMLQDA